MSRFIICFSVLLSTFAASCGGESSPTTESIPAVSPDVPEDFSRFYYSFHSDSVYQMNHILFPLEGRPASDQGSGHIDDFRWQQNNWKLHHFDRFDPALFTIIRTVTDSTLITEIIRDNQNGLGIKRRFAKFDDKWYLIYYSAMNPVQ